MTIYNKIPGNKKIITGIGSALVDILINETDEFLESLNGQKGGMTFVEMPFIEKALQQSTEKPALVPGGSACNTAVGVGKLGGQAHFVGKCGKDDTSVFYRRELEKSNVHPYLIESDAPTGRVLSVITPDAQRTFLTCLGASALMLPEEITPDRFKGSAIVHLEGYLIFNKDLILSALASAKKAGALISLDMASYTVVEQEKDLLDQIIKEYVDILIANEDEARVFTGDRDEKAAVLKMAGAVDIAVLKKGKRGSSICHRGQVVDIAPAGSEGVVDTTGAGDLWAAGFLFGLVNQYPLEKCGDIASACGYEVCRVIGAHVGDKGWKRIEKLMEE